MSIFDGEDSTDSATKRLINLPDDLSKVFERDRAVAGIGNEKRSPSGTNGKRWASEAGGTRTRNLRIDSLAGRSSNGQKPQRVTKPRSLRDANGDTNSLENDRGDAVSGSVSIKANSLAIKADSFSAALAMIASLPLSDAEKADAVRRLMAEQAGSPE